VLDVPAAQAFGVVVDAQNGGGDGALLDPSGGPLLGLGAEVLGERVAVAGVDQVGPARGDGEQQVGVLCGGLLATDYAGTRRSVGLHGSVRGGDLLSSSR
jgi:hypothetical protein